MPSVPAVTAPLPGNITPFVPGNATTRGWEFTTTGVTITHMGFWDNGGDGLVNSHEVAIFDSSHSIVLSATIPAGTGTILGTDNVRYVVLGTPFVLAAGTYRMGAFYDVSVDDEPSNNWRDNSGNGPIGASGITYVASRRDASLNPALTDPVDTSANIDGIFGPLFMILVGSPCDLTVSPSSVTLAPGATQVFTASGTSTPVTWTITEVGGGSLSGATGTSVTYTAPLTPGTYHVVATSDADPTCKDTATVSVEGPAKGAGRGYRVAGPVLRRRRPSRAIFYGHGFWGKPNPPTPVPVCAVWKVRVKGFKNAESLCAADYGLPTIILACGPLEACTVNTFEQPLVDANGMAAGEPCLIELERDATDGDNTDTNPQAFYALELSWDETS